MAKAYVAPARRSSASRSVGFVGYLALLRDAFIEALEQTSEARRKNPFADV